MEVIRVKESGPLTTIQDQGRFGYQKFGMPTSGAVDQFSARTANLLVSNNDDDAVLEFTYKGPKLEFIEDAVIAITGANAVPMIDDLPAPMWRSIYVKKGSVLSFAGLKDGFRGYIALQSGIKVEKIMGSRSTYMRGKLGGKEGRKLKSGDEIEVYNSVKREDFRELYLPQSYLPDFKRKKVRVVLGPQAEAFTEKGLNNFLKGEYSISGQADRMGYRLEGPSIEHRDSADIISDGIPRGAIQVPGHGKPIIMLADRQTTGGYTKIAVVVSVDVDLVAQKKPGDKIEFEKVELEKAHRLLEDREKVYQEIAEEKRRFSRVKYFQMKVGDEDFKVKIEEIEED